MSMLAGQRQRTENRPVLARGREVADPVGKIRSDRSGCQISSLTTANSDETGRSDERSIHQGRRT
ncbi:hypothetical protein M6B38_394525 [Iris pallida]|uniref:Uncharacterized protein n=1 Tax=Iris pallida TaxID=29817 RepID=A0AAX6FWY3_IRIPA|nr:hypothetical protein M6B38_394525 [Iris pallida]